MKDWLLEHLHSNLTKQVTSYRAEAAIIKEHVVTLLADAESMLKKAEDLEEAADDLTKSFPR